MAALLWICNSSPYLLLPPPPKKKKQKTNQDGSKKYCTLISANSYSLVSMTFGRPPMTSSLSISPEMLTGAPVSSDLDSLKLAFYYENVKLSVILEDILQRIYRPWLTRDANTGQAHHNLDTIVDIQGQLDAFERSVTPLLSWKTQGEMPESMPESDRDITRISQNVLYARCVLIPLAKFSSSPLLAPS